MSQRIADELAGIQLGDERLNKRSRKVIEALAANPEASVNAAMNGWADTQAAYRFFDNGSVTPEHILKPHREATLERMREHSVVLIAQDTTELDYTDHPAQDALCLNQVHRFGLYHHVQLALTPDRLPLGVVATTTFDREPETLGKDGKDAAAEKRRPLSEKESFRWMTGYLTACDVAKQCPNIRVVSVADREADIYDIFLEAQNVAGPKADYLIRAHEDRSTPERNRAVSRRTYHKVREQLESSPLLATHVIALCATPKREAREARVEVRAIRTEVKPPNHRPNLDIITHNIILVCEIDGPGDDSDVCWVLVTTLPVDTVAQILMAVEYYAARWTIESYFRVLKTGCRVERIMLETKARLLNCLAMYNIIAWRVLYLTYLNRTCPNLPCTAVFANDEWQPAWRIVRKSQPPRTPPTLNEFMKVITHLGGYNNRAKEAPSGPQPIWTGLRRMLDFSTAWLTFSQPAKDVCK